LFPMRWISITGVPMLLNRKKVLIADPSPIFRRTLKAAIETNETLVDVAEADSINVAEDILGNHQMDVVFLEIEFPADDGMRLIDFIKGLAADIRIVVLTRQDSAVRKRAALEKGADYFLSKGRVHGLRLVDVIHATIRR
jgi:DNA-binding NarL/FixJ family response regulator